MSATNHEKRSVSNSYHHYKRRMVQLGLLTPEKLAQQFHETYERLAPEFNYETREASAVPWRDVPEQNKRLMIAVAAEVLREGE